MPMQPSPMAETSNSLFPSLRFCIMTPVVATDFGATIHQECAAVALHFAWEEIDHMLLRAGGRKIFAENSKRGHHLSWYPSRRRGILISGNCCYAFKDRKLRSPFRLARFGAGVARWVHRFAVRSAIRFGCFHGVTPGTRRARLLVSVPGGGRAENRTALPAGNDDPRNRLSMRWRCCALDRLYAAERWAPQGDSDP